jgi:hypothetical protein
MSTVMLVGAASAAVSCPSGSTTFDTEPDANGNQLVQNADNFGTGADTCFTHTSSGGMALTQTEQTKSGPPTSYPDNSYGCSGSYCSTRWISPLWSSTTMQVTGSINTTTMEANTTADMLVDSIFSATGGSGKATAAEIEILTWANPGYSSIGICAAASCGATLVTINGTSWWRSFQASNWPKWDYARATMTKSVTSLPLQNFYTNANAANPSHLGTDVLNQAAIGDELWQNGTGLKLVSTSAINVP